MGVLFSSEYPCGNFSIQRGLSYVAKLIGDRRPKRVRWFDLATHVALR
jgi:hypothetical protein